MIILSKAVGYDFSLNIIMESLVVSELETKNIIGLFFLGEDMRLDVLHCIALHWILLIVSCILSQNKT